MTQMFADAVVNILFLLFAFSRRAMPYAGGCKAVGLVGLTFFLSPFPFQLSTFNFQFSLVYTRTQSASSRPSCGFWAAGMNDCRAT